MEKKMKTQSLDKLILPLFILAVTFIAGVISQNPNLWFLPLIGGVVTVLGELFKQKWLINIGVSTAILTFFFLNYTLSFTLTNLTILLVLFIIMIIIWVFARNSLVTSQIKKDLVEEKDDKYLREYYIHSSTDMVTELLLAFLIAFIGSMIALYSYTDIFMVSSLAVPLAVIFSAFVFVVIYILIEVLPGYLTDKDS
ncbi:MAG: hypothetical protein ACOC5D_00935 [Thermoplasmatota archaeon]